MYSSIKQIVRTGSYAISTFVILTGLVFSQVSRADQSCLTCKIEVLFRGIFSDETCKVVVNGATDSETVVLPTLSIASLKSNGSEAGSRPFDISLKECPTERTVSVIFKSNLYAADTTTGNLINNSANGHSQNVQIRIRKENGTQVKIDDANTGQDYLIPVSGEDVTHNFTASYYAKGNNTVTPGVVKTAAAIDLIYK